MKEIRYHECNGLQTKCPYGMTEPLYNSLASKEPSSYGDIYVGSTACMMCKHYDRPALKAHSFRGGMKTQTDEVGTIFSWSFKNY